MAAKTKLETADAEALARVREARERLRDAESRHLIAKENAKAAKASWEAAVEHLTEVIDSETRPMPLFDAAPKPVDLPTVEVCGGTESHGLEFGTLCEILEVKPGGVVVRCEHGETSLTENEYTHDEDLDLLLTDARENGVDGPDSWREFVRGWRDSQANAWRDLPIGEAGIAGKVAQTLTDADCGTLGQLVERMAGGLGWNEGLKGIGEEKAAAIADKVADFWRNNPQYVPAA